MVEDRSNDGTVDSEIEDGEDQSVGQEHQEQEAPKKKAFKAQSKRDPSEDGDKWQPRLDQYLELKQESLERKEALRAQKAMNAKLEKQLAELSESLEKQRTEFESTRKAQQDRIIRTELLSKLKSTGCVKPDMALSMLSSHVEFDKNGDVSNAEELITKFKEENAFFFTGPATTSPHEAPRPKQFTDNNMFAGKNREDKLAMLRARGIQI